MTRDGGDGHVSSGSDDIGLDAAAGGTSALQVGRIVRSHGLRGAVVVEMLSNRDERTEPGSQLMLEWPDGEDVAGSTTTPEPPMAVTVVQARRLPSGGGGPRARWVVQFHGIDGREAADRLRGSTLWGAALDDIEPEALWVHQLVGCSVVDLAGAPLGVVAAILANPASDLMELAGGGLVPLCFVVEHGPGRVVVDAPPGLLD